MDFKSCGTVPRKEAGYSSWELKLAGFSATELDEDRVASS
jgi:hypothetical protein